MKPEIDEDTRHKEPAYSWQPYDHYPDVGRPSFQERADQRRQNTLTQGYYLNEKVKRVPTKYMQYEIQNDIGEIIRFNFNMETCIEVHWTPKIGSPYNSHYRPEDLILVSPKPKELKLLAHEATRSLNKEDDEDYTIMPLL